MTTAALVVGAFGNGPRAYLKSFLSKADTTPRERFTQNLVDGEHAASGKNVLVVRASSTYSEALQGICKDCKVKFMHTTYRVIVFDSGRFELKSDGGYRNWCYCGGTRIGKRVEW